MSIDLEKLDAKERQTFEAMLAKMGTSAVVLSGKNPLSGAVRNSVGIWWRDLR
jgi:hypothetical protein